MPTGTVDADPDLRRESPFGDLAVERGAGESRSSQDRLQANYAFGIRHGVVPLSAAQPLLIEHNVSIYFRFKPENSGQ